MAKKGGLGRGMEALLENMPAEVTKNTAEKDETAKKTATKKTSTKTSTKAAGSKTTDKTGDKTPAKSSGKQSSGKTTKSTTGKTTKSTAGKTTKSTAGKAAKSAEPAEQMIPINKVEPNRDQPRKNFDEEGLNELADSIKTFGVLQPLLVQKQDDYYRIIAGERRWRAAKIAGLKKVPVIVKDLSEKEILEISLIENLQREDLNPIEEAEGYQRLLQEFDMTQEELAKRVSKNRSTITNTVRLLKLDESVQRLLKEGAITSGHARALLSLENTELQKEAAERVVRDQLSVRDTERLVKALTGKKAVRKPETTPQDDFIYRDIEEKMRQILGTKVQIKNRKKSGRIEIEYYSPDELNRILELLQTIE